MKSTAKKSPVAKKAVKMNSSKKKNNRRVLGLNSAKQVEGTWYYDINDMETVVAAVLNEIDSDPGAAITLEPSDTGIILNVTSSEGEEFTTEVELISEGEGEEAEDAGAGEEEPVGEDEEY